MNSFIEEYYEYLLQQRNELTEEIEFLSSEDRNDESDHKKIERNVIDIFTKMFNISQQQAGSDKMKLKKVFLSFLENISKNWYSNLEKCKVFDNEEEAYIQKLKISRKDKLKERFLEMM